MSKINLHFGLVVAYLLGNINFTIAQQKEQFQFNHKAIYEVTYLPDSLKKDSQKQELTELLLGNEVSLFRSTQKAYEDSIYMAYINRKVMTMSAPTITTLGAVNAFNYQVLKDYKSGKTKVYDEYTGSNLNNLKELAYYFEPKEVMTAWTLKDDTLMINGHLCQQAEIEFGGRVWTAWFASGLSAYSDGPYKFKGLPGLIFRVYDADKTWDFKLIDLSKVDTLVSINFKDGLSFSETTKAELYKNRRHYQKNMIEINEAAGIYYGDGKAELKKILETNILHDNNWIELAL